MDDADALSTPEVFAAFENFVRANCELVLLLQKQADQDDEMLMRMR